MTCPIHNTPLVTVRGFGVSEETFCPRCHPLPAAQPPAEPRIVGMEIQ